MPINNKINRDHDTSWLKSNKKQDIPDSTHKLVSVNNTFRMLKIHQGGIAVAEIKDLLGIDLAVEVTSEQGFKILKFMTKEVDAANRFALVDGIIQGEFEIWDDNFEKRLYFCVDFTLEQAIKFAKNDEPFIGFSLATIPNMLVGGQVVFRINDLRNIIKVKLSEDAKNTPPVHSWKRG